MYSPHQKHQICRCLADEWLHTTVRPVSTVFLTVLITIAAALASSPEVDSSMNIMEGLETSSTAIVSLFCYSVEDHSLQRLILFMGLTLQAP